MIQILSRWRPLGKQRLVPASLLQDIGDQAVALIRARTEGGKDFQGRAFRPLSPLYRAQKQKAIGHGRADLTVSGRMLNDMQARVTGKNTVEIGFVSSGGRGRGGTFIQRSRAVGAADKAYWHHVSGAGKAHTKRRFFDLSKKERAALADRVANAIDLK